MRCLVRVLALALLGLLPLGSASAQPTARTEDFTGDPGPGGGTVGDFESFVFVHSFPPTVTPAYSFVSETGMSGSPSALPFPSSPWALWLAEFLQDDQGMPLVPRDTLSFALGDLGLQNPRVVKASVWANPLFNLGVPPENLAEVVFVGASDSKTFSCAASGDLCASGLSDDVWEFLSASSLDLGDSGFALGEIVEVRISGSALLVDEITIDVDSDFVPPPPVGCDENAPGAIFATPGVLTLGTAGDDVIIGSAGDDVIVGGAGDDCIDGREGLDRIRGGPGDDLIFGGQGPDRVYGGGGDDTIDLGMGHDRAKGGKGNDHIDGGIGDDRLFGDAGQDTILGGPGDDLIRGGGERDRLAGEGGSDFLRGDAGDDVIDGGPDEDKIRGGAGIDSCVGGEDVLQCEAP